MGKGGRGMMMMIILPKCWNVDHHWIVDCTKFNLVLQRLFIGPASCHWTPDCFTQNSNPPLLESRNLTNWQLQSYSMPGFAQMCLVVVQARQPLVCSLKQSFCSKLSIFSQPEPWHFATLTSKTKECLLTSQWKYYWTRVPIPALIYPRQRSRLYAKACHI